MDSALTARSCARPSPSRAALCLGCYFLRFGTNQFLPGTSPSSVPHLSRKLGGRHSHDQVFPPSGSIQGKVWGCCPENWMVSNTSCYFITSEENNWTESEKKCTGMGAHLLVINIKEEQLFITQKLNRKSSYYMGLSEPKWIDQWQWVDQSPYKKNVTFWHPGESNNHKQHCVFISFLNGKWGWNAASCDMPQKSICEMMKIYL